MRFISLSKSIKIFALLMLVPSCSINTQSISATIYDGWDYLGSRPGKWWRDFEYEEFIDYRSAGDAAKRILFDYNNLSFEGKTISVFNEQDIVDYTYKYSDKNVVMIEDNSFRDGVSYCLDYDSGVYSCTMSGKEGIYDETNGSVANSRYSFKQVISYTRDLQTQFVVLLFQGTDQFSHSHNESFINIKDSNSGKIQNAINDVRSFVTLNDWTSDILQKINDFYFYDYLDFEDCTYSFSFMEGLEEGDKYIRSLKLDTAEYLNKIYIEDGCEINKYKTNVNSYTFCLHSSYRVLSKLETITEIDYYSDGRIRKRKSTNYNTINIYDKNAEKYDKSMKGYFEIENVNDLEQQTKDFEKTDYEFIYLPKVGESKENRYFHNLFNYFYKEND